MRRALALALLLAAAPAAAGEMYAVSCPSGGFTTRVLEGVGRVEAALGLRRQAYWCPAQGRMISIWVAGDDPLARELLAIAGSGRPDAAELPVSRAVGQWLERGGVATVGELRRRLAQPTADGPRTSACPELVPLRAFTAGGRDFPLCDEGGLEMRKLPVAWD